MCLASARICKRSPNMLSLLIFPGPAPPGNMEPHGARIEIANSCDKADRAIGVALRYLRSLQTAGAVSSLCKMTFLGAGRE